MPVIVVANPKGGVGKSTLSSNIAGYFAHAGKAVMLGDIDRQQSARHWLALRPDTVPKIEGWQLSGDRLVRPPKGVSHVILDTPAGLHGKRLDEVLKLADKLLVPLQPSLFDIEATFDFVRTLRANPGSAKVDVALVGMRAREGTLSVVRLREFLSSLDVPLMAMLRDTQNYVQLAAHGLTLWDVAPSRVERDLAQWDTLLRWLQLARPVVKS